MILDGLMCILIKFANLLFFIFFGWWIDMIILILNLLPTTPFLFEENVQWGDFGNAVGYFIPVEKMFLHFGALITAVITYYAVQHVLRLLRVIR